MMGPEYTVEITRLSDGAKRTVVMPFPWDEAARFQWTEGNYSCDCNRELEFERPDITDALPECSNGRYSVLLPDGTTA